MEYNKNDIFWKKHSKLPGNPYILSRSIGPFKCLLVFLTKKTSIFSGDYPIAMGYMASLLRMNGALADILVQDIDTYEGDKFPNYDLICFYPMVALLTQTLDFLSEVKLHYPETKTCLFNSEQHQHEMLFCSPGAIEIARNVMEEYPAVDFVLIGEAEYSFLKLCEKIALKEPAFVDLPACLYREGKKVGISEAPIRPVVFDYLPYPSRDFIETTIKEHKINSFSVRVQSSRGCLGRCLYCAESSSNITVGGRKRAWLGRNIHHFVDEIEMLHNNYGIVFFNVIDSSFEDPGIKGLERVKNFCDEIRRRKLLVSFKIHLRIETVSKLSDEFILMLKEAGVDILILGAESGLEYELKSYKKLTTAQKNVDNCIRLEGFERFFLLIGHMMFSPLIKLEDLPLKIDFLNKVGHAWDYMNLSNNLLVFAGTAYHDLLKQKGLMTGSNRVTGIISYRYEDEKVQYVATEMGYLKVRCPEVVYLNNLIYDALNIRSRYFNRMNQHLWRERDEFLEFTKRLDKILKDIADIYNSYFLDLVNLAGSGWVEEAASYIYDKRLHGFCRAAVASAEDMIDKLISQLNKKNLSTGKLHLKTWMSIINTQINTAGGKVL